MIPITTRKGQTIALFGLGGSGLVTAKALAAGGANVIAFDDNPKSVEAAASDGIDTQDLRELDFASVDALVLAPGVPLTHPQPHWTVDLARSDNVPVIGDIELFATERRAMAPDCGFIAITGTNGKSTTTALIAHILRQAGKDVQMGGNIGQAALSLDTFSSEKIYVIECSSYQIDLAPTLDPQIGILLNLAPDHLDRHGTMEHYASIKARLVRGSETAITGEDDPYSSAIASELGAAGHPPITISVNKDSQSDYVFDGISVLSKVDAVVSFSLAEAPTLRGLHNAQNAMAAIPACLESGLTTEEIQNGLNSFPGLAHRMEILGNLGTTIVVNDSKGTNADAAAMALSSFENIYWIAGGLAKEGGIESLRPHFSRIKKAYLIGEAASQFAATLGNDVDYEISETIENAVANAASDVNGDGGVMLLSPACASFDQFRNFEIRGDTFRAAVEKLSGFKPFEGKTA